MLQKSTKIIATLSITCFLVSIIIFGIFLGTVSKQKAEHLAHAQDSAETKAHKESLQRLMQVLDETKVSRESLQTRFVKDDEVISLLALIETLARERGVEYTTKSLMVTPGNEYFESLDIQIEVKGSYQQVLETLGLFEQLPFQTSVYSTNIQKNDTDVWSGNFSIGITKFTKNEN